MQFYEARDDYKASLVLNSMVKDYTVKTKIEHFKRMKQLHFAELLSQEQQRGRGSEMTRLAFNQYSAFLAFEKLGRPYLKVYPQMAGLMCRTRIDIPEDHLKLPFDAFEIRMPMTGSPLVDDPKHPLRAIIVAEQMAAVGDDSAHRLVYGTHTTVRTMYLFMDFGESVRMPTDVTDKDVEVPVYNFLNLIFYPGETVVQAMDRARSKIQPTDGYQPSAQLLDGILSMTVASTFFMNRQHSMIMPDIHPRFKQRWEKAQKTGDSRETEQIRQNCKKLNHYGWNLKSNEIELPRPVYETPADATSASREERGRRFELRFSQLRSGHLRMQPYGPKDAPTHHEVIFIPPTQVRPDLPTRPHPGFVLKDNLRGIHGNDANRSEGTEAGH